MANIVRMPQPMKEIGDTISIVDDFEWYISPHRWTSLAADSGSAVAIAAGVGGILSLTPGTTDNNECAAYTTNSVFKPTANKPFYHEWLVQFSEANTSAMNAFAGLASSPGANLLIDDGGGPRTSGTVIGIYKLDGGTVWRCVSRNGSNVTDSVSTTTAGGTAYQKLSVEVIDVLPTSMTIVFKVDGNLLKDSAGNVIKHQLDPTGIAAASLVIYCKEGSTSAETLLVDYVAATATR